MENLDFGPGFEIMVLAIAFAQLTLRTIIALIIIHYLTKQITPIASRLLGYENKLTGISRYDFIAYEVSWFFIAPLVSGLFETFLRQLYTSGSFNEYQGSFSYLYFYLLSLTIWSYDSDFEKFKLKPFGKIILQGIAYLLLNFILNIISFKTIKDIHSIGTITYLFHYVIYPTAFGLLTIYYVRKNRQAETNNA